MWMVWANLCLAVAYIVLCEKRLVVIWVIVMWVVVTVGGDYCGGVENVVIMLALVMNGGITVCMLRVVLIVVLTAMVI